MNAVLQPLINMGTWAWGLLAGVVVGVFGQELAPSVLFGIKTLLLIVCIIAPLMGAVAYLTLWERKLIGWMQVRIGPNRVTFFGIRWLGGLAQPIADGVKLLLKEIIVPAGANKFLFVLAPIMVIMPALAAWAVVPFNPEMVLANVDAGLLYIMAITSMGVYGVIVAGWASNSKYAFLGALRSAAQIVSYEFAMGFALVGVLMAAQSLNLVDIVNGQKGNWGVFNWFWIPLFPMFLVYFISSCGGNQPRAVRRRRGRIRNRRRLSRRIFGHGVRGILPRRIRQHDPGVDAVLDHVSRRLAVAGAGGARQCDRAAVARRGQLRLAVRQAVLRGVGDHMAPRHLPALPL